jgi:hypothetical protein
MGKNTYYTLTKGDNFLKKSHSKNRKGSLILDSENNSVKCSKMQNEDLSQEHKKKKKEKSPSKGKSPIVKLGEKTMNNIPTGREELWESNSKPRSSAFNPNNKDLKKETESKNEESIKKRISIKEEKRKSKSEMEEEKEEVNKKRELDLFDSRMVKLCESDSLEFSLSEINGECQNNTLLENNKISNLKEAAPSMSMSLSAHIPPPPQHLQHPQSSEFNPTFKSKSPHSQNHNNQIPFQHQNNLSNDHSSLFKLFDSSHMPLNTIHTPINAKFAFLAAFAVFLLSCLAAPLSLTLLFFYAFFNFILYLC